MKVAVCMVAFIFSAITEMAAWIQMSKEPSSKYNALLMISGALISFIGMLTCLIYNWRYDWLLSLIGYGMIIVAAILNGMKKNHVHVGHHVVRCVLCLLLVVGFCFV